MATAEEVRENAIDLRDQLRANGVPDDKIGEAVTKYVNSVSIDDDRAGMLQFLNRGIAQGLGAPVDLVAAGLRKVGVPVGDDPVLGGRMIERGFRGILGEGTVPPEGQQAEGFFENVAQGTGQALGGVVPAGAVVSKTAQLPNMAGRIAGEIQGTVARQPIAATVSEGLAGAGAAAGGFAGEQLGDGPVPIIAEILGGFAGGLAPSAIPTKLLATQAKKTLVPFTKAGAMPRAEGRMKELATDPQQAAAQITDEGPLTPAQQTGDPALMALEREAALAQGAKAQVARTEQIGQAREQLTDELGGMADEGNFAGFMQERIDKALQAVQSRVDAANSRAQERLNRLSPKRRKSENARIVREEIDTAFAEAREAEGMLWDAIPGSVKVPTNSTRTLFRDLASDTPRAQQADIPGIAKALLGGDGGFGDLESAAEMIGLYKKLGDVQRVARTRPDGGNTVRIATLLREAILDDIGKVQAPDDVFQYVSNALQFSRNMNQTFSQGATGRIRSAVREGGDRIAPEETLATTTGRGGEGGARSTRELLASSEGIDGQFGTPQAQSAVEDYLKGVFQSAAVKNGVVSKSSAERFVKVNEETLDLFPSLKRDMLDAATSQEAASRITARGEKVAKKVSKTPTEIDIKSIVSSKDEAKRIIQTATKDKTGAALESVKGDFVSHLISQKNASSMDSVLSSEGGAEILSQFKPHQQERISRIVSDLKKLDVAQGELPDVDGLISDTPNTILRYIAQVLGARVGAAAGKGTSGASLVTSNLGSKRARAFLESMTSDEAKKLLVDAIEGDRRLFRMLLMNTTQPKQARTVSRRLNAWILTLEDEKDAN